MTDEEKLIEIVGRAIEAADTLDRDKLARAALAAINLPARLEAAHTQGWNEAIEAAKTLLIVHLYPILSSPTRSADWHRAETAINIAIRALTKEIEGD